MFVPDVVHCEDVPDIKFKLPLLSILNWAVLYFKVIVFDVFKNGFEKVNVFCFADKFDIVAYVDDAVDDNK